jgi:3-oxoacyl-[acyl-carrier protein] reductase
MSNVVLITGCSTGIGRHLAQRLTQLGYTVVATARKVETLDDLTVALKLQLDVTQTDSVNQAIALTLQQFGRIDTLVNNAGYCMLGALEEVTEEQTQQVFDVNVFGALRMIRAVVPHMREQRAGRIINISSVVSTTAIPEAAVYSGTKGAVDAITRSLAAELGPRGIRVNAIRPGMVVTEGTRSAGIPESEMRKQVEAQTPLRRIGQPHDITGAAVFLASDDSAWITGETLTISGGYR